MLSVNSPALQQMMDTLSTHDHLAYGILFLGAFFETLIPFSLFVLGELFLLAGALLAGMQVLNVWLVLIVLCAGGILGDNASYWLGRHFGSGLFELLTRLPVIKKLASHDNYQRGKEFFQRRGAFTVFAARLSGPLSWVMPAIAGMFRLNYATFIRFNTIGVILGIGQFIVVGYFFGASLPTILSYAERYNSLLVYVLLALFVLAIVYWWAKRRTPGSV